MIDFLNESPELSFAVFCIKQLITNHMPSYGCDI